MQGLEDTPGKRWEESYQSDTRFKGYSSIDTRDTLVYRSYTRDTLVYRSYTRDTLVYRSYTRDILVYRSFIRILSKAIFSVYYLSWFL